jgi:hypothetical protein
MSHPEQGNTKGGSVRNIRRCVVLQKGQPNVTQTLPTCLRAHPSEKKKVKKVKPGIWFGFGEWVCSGPKVVKNERIGLSRQNTLESSVRCVVVSTTHNHSLSSCRPRTILFLILAFGGTFTAFIATDCTAAVEFDSSSRSGDAEAIASATTR